MSTEQWVAMGALVMIVWVLSEVIEPAEARPLESDPPEPPV